MNRQKIIRLVGSVLLVLALAIAGYLWWRSNERRGIAVACIPHQPSLQGKPAEFQQRVRACEQRIKAGSAVTEALGELSQLYHANGYYAEASQCYQGLIRIDPSNPRWTHRFASILAGYGQLEDAMALWRRTLALAKDYLPAQIRLADAMLKFNQAAEAGKIYANILKQDAENPYALVGLARIDIEAGRWTSARDRLEAATARSNYSIGSDLLVTVCEQLGDNSRAEYIRSRVKADGGFFDTPDPWLRELAFDCYDSFQLTLTGGVAVREGDLATAISLVERAISFEPKNGYYRIQAAGLYQQSHNNAKARQHLEMATEVAPDNTDTWQHLARFLAAAGQQGEAEGVVATGLTHCPDSPGLHFLRGQYRVKAGRLEEALSDFKVAAAALNDDASPSLSLATVYIRLNRMPEALASLQKALAAEAEHPAALSILAIYYIEQGDEPSAGKWMLRVKAQPRIQPQERLQLEQAFQRAFGHAPY
jgi:predicted Zn-dependent protease